jgi:hypothetical protein
MSAHHTIKKLGHNIVLKEIQHLTGMTHCALFSGLEQFAFSLYIDWNFISYTFTFSSSLLSSINFVPSSFEEDFKI